MAGPQVVAAGPNDMRMYYFSFDAAKQRYGIGLATSDNGFKCDPALSLHLCAALPFSRAECTKAERLRHCSHSSVTRLVTVSHRSLRMQVGQAGLHLLRR